MDLRKGNIILSMQAAFVYRKKRKMKPEVFCVPNTSATASAINDSWAVDKCGKVVSWELFVQFYAGTRKLLWDLWRPLLK